MIYGLLLSSVVNHPVRLLSGLAKVRCVWHLVSVEGKKLVKLHWAIRILDLITDHLTKAPRIKVILVIGLRDHLGGDVSSFRLSHEVALLGTDDR